MRVHHSAVVVADIEASTRFYREGLGMTVIMDTSFDGDWPALFNARSNRLRSVFLGDAEDSRSGIVELVAFDGGADQRPVADAPAAGLFLLSFNVDVAATLENLRRIGVSPVGRTSMPGPKGPVAMVTLRDPDGVLIELIDLP